MKIKTNTKYHAHHVPSGEDWVILGVKKDKSMVAAAGWPPSLGKFSDCINFEEAGELTHEEIKHRNTQFGGGWI